MLIQDQLGEADVHLLRNQRERLTELPMSAKDSSARATLPLLTLMEKARTMWLQNSTEMPQLCKRKENSAGEVEYEDTSNNVTT